MLLTTEEHFRRFYPEENVDGFDTIYFSKGGEDIFAFLLVKGKMEDIKVYTHGNFNEESLERQIFSLISKYGKGEWEKEVGWDNEQEQEKEAVREELLRRNFSFGETGRTLICIFILSFFEALGIGGSYLLGVNKGNLILLICACCIFDLSFFFLCKDKNPKKGDVDR